MSPRIAISSCAFGRVPFNTLEEVALRRDWTVEFSSGFAFEPDLPQKFATARCRRWIHNYFPAPQKAFVLNLASKDPAIRAQSIAHAKQGLDLAKRCGAGFYSVHAGFGVDPSPSELGQPIKAEPSVSRDVYWSFFTTALGEVLAHAQVLGVDLLVENNVVIASNRNVPLLCASLDEVERLFRDVPHPRLGLLLDTAHLKVSAVTFGFDAERFVEGARPFVRGLHHSDNDGLRDSNQPLTEDYWFLPHMHRFADRPHSIEVDNLTETEIQRHIDLLAGAMAGGVR